MPLWMMEKLKEDLRKDIKRSIINRIRQYARFYRIDYEQAAREILDEGRLNPPRIVERHTGGSTEGAKRD